LKRTAKDSAKDHLPIQPVLEELALLRRDFRDIIRHYSARIEAEIAQLISLVANESEGRDPEPEKMRELRDMLMLLRDLDVKASKGRRRDLKRIETTVEELRSITERW
jgi:hypothetical protein